ncbi:MAG: VCBS repeat-containing protein, partial [Xylanibacter rarus]
MKAKLYLVSALIASAGTAFAASQKPQYNEMTLPGGVSTAYFRGSLVYADVNGDGNMDLIVKGRDLNNGWNPDVVLITTDNSGNLDSSVKLPASMPYESTLSAFDFNNDGHVDYLLCNYGYELYRNNGDGTFAKVENFALESNLNISDDNGTSECWYMGLTAIADFDMDGYQDLVVMDADGNPV